MSLTTDLNRLRALITEIRRKNGRKTFNAELINVDKLTDFVLFGKPDEGWVLLSDSEALEYRKCLDKLSSSVEDRYSRKTVEKLMQTAILKTLDVKKQRTRILFE